MLLLTPLTSPLTIHAQDELVQTKKEWLQSRGSVYQELNKTTIKLIMDYEREYGVRIVIPNRHLRVHWGRKTINGSPISTREVQEYLPKLIQEMRLYPVSTVKKSELKTIVLLDKLKFGQQPRSTIPDYRDGQNTMYFDAGLMKHYKPHGKQQVKYIESYLRRMVHHEYFHFLDFKDDGLIYQDRAFIKLNPMEFVYGSGGANMRDPDAGVFTEQFTGFMNRYATSGVEEDKAETFSAMITHASYTEKRMKKDPVLASKGVFIRLQLQKFDPAWDEEFWDKLHKLPRHQASKRPLTNKEIRQKNLNPNNTVAPPLPQSPDESKIHTPSDTSKNNNPEGSAPDDQVMP